MRYMVRLFIILLFSSFVACSTSFANKLDMTPTETKKFINEAFKNLLEDLNATEQTYDRYISKDFVQYVNGNRLNYPDYIAHRKEHKETMKSAKITVKDMIVEGDKVATIHIAQGIKKDGTPVKVQINAFLQVKDGKIIYWNQLTQPIK